MIERVWRFPGLQEVITDSDVPLGVSSVCQSHGRPRWSGQASDKEEKQHDAASREPILPRNRGSFSLVVRSFAKVLSIARCHRLQNRMHCPCMIATQESG